MKHILLVGGVYGLAACASAPPKPEQALLGAWSCESKVDDTTIKGDITYLAGGAATLAVTLSGTGRVAFEATGAGEGSWALSEDGGQLEETVTKLNVISAKANGNDIPPALAQAFVEPALPDLSATSRIDLDADRLVKTAADGTATTCTR